MLDDRKLEHVKRCASLLLQFMKEDDRISLISFGEDAELHLKSVPADQGNKSVIQQSIQSLECRGCTNMSAGLGYVRTACETSNLKTGLLLLTDGHANRGVSSPSELRSIMSTLCSTFPNLSCHCVAYGSDHNEDLMRAFAEDNRGSYNVVTTLEDTAFAFGDTLGGLMSCVHQNVQIEVPIGTEVLGPHKYTERNERLWISLGDVYAGTKPLVLFHLPCNDMNIRVHGMSLPDLQSWTIEPIPQTCTTRQKDVHLTQLRYMCTHILEGLNTWYSKTIQQQEKLKRGIETFKESVNDTFFDGDPIANLLRSELSVINDLLRRAESGDMDHQTHCITTQHITSIGLGRGFSSPMAQHRTRSRIPRAPSRFGASQMMRNWSSATEDEEHPTDPVNMGIHSAPSNAFQLT
jgi:hypothetical protein